MSQANTAVISALLPEAPDEIQALREREQRRVALRDAIVRLLDPALPVLLGLTGFAVFVLIWEAIHLAIAEIPSPAFTLLAAIMVTHDVDEAVLLSDRIVMMTNGPAARIGEVLEVNLERPRDRVALANDPVYQGCRTAVLDFLYRKQGNPALAAA